MSELRRAAAPPRVPRRQSGLVGVCTDAAPAIYSSWKTRTVGLRRPHVVMPHVHRVASLVQRWLLGTHQGAISHHQLDYYLDEFMFRFNRRRSRHRGLLFYRLLEGAVAADPHPYKALTSKSAA
jgi:hypothetical protein